MAEEQATIPGLPVPVDPMLPTAGMSPALQIMLNPVLFERAQSMAKFMSQAEGFLPKHLIGRPAACFAVLTRAITWKLDPYAVGQSTFQLPGSDRVGYEGKLIAAILENSGKLEGGVKHKHFGEWSRVLGKFEIATSGKGNQYAKATWGRADAEGLGIEISVQIKGELEPRVYEFLLVQAFPMNSTLWATDPKTQIFYTAVRRFASVVASGLLMGVPWEGDYLPGDDARELNPTPPAPERSGFVTGTAKAAPPAEEKEEKTFGIIGVPEGEVLFETDDAAEFAKLLLLEATRLKGDKGLLDALWENNSPQFSRIEDKAAAQALRDAWPKFEPPITDGSKAQPGLKV